MKPSKQELARIVEAHEIPEQARIALEKLVCDMDRQKATVQDKLASAVEEADACKRASLSSNAVSSRLRVENESLAQQLSGRDSTIARMQESISRLESNLVKQQERGYNVPMIQDFLEQLVLNLRCIVWEIENVNDTNPGLLFGELEKYTERYGQIGRTFVPVLLHKPGETPRREELLVPYKSELAALELLLPRLEFALEAARRPNDTFIMNMTDPEKSHWICNKDMLRRMKNGKYVE